MLEMDEAYARDQAEREVLRGAREALLMLLAGDVARLSTKSRWELQKCAGALWEDILRLDQVWD